MVFADMPQNVEAGHRFHLDVGDHHLRLDYVELLDRFRSGIEWENLMALVPAKRHNDLHHRGLIVDYDDLSHVAVRRVVSEVRKSMQKRESSHSWSKTRPSIIFQGT